MELSRRNFLARSAIIPAASAGAAIFPPAWAAESPWTLPPKQDVEVIDNGWVPLKDGIRLNIRLWLPADAHAKKAPVVWEYHPYGRFSFEGIWAETLASHGIAYARVDVRGGADSDGILPDEYLDQELHDGVEVIDWLSKQPWCNGNVGQRGLSWAGINTLQIAALAPPALKAIMPMGCCDVRFTDDAHYIGGGLGLTNFQWGVQFRGVMSRPPNPKYYGDKWEALWRERLEASPDIMARWLEHQRYDAYWQRGSIAQNYGAIKCPVYIVDGWIDTYSNVVGRILSHLKVPKKGLVGSWGHTYPNFTHPGPGLDWAYEEVRWWDQWLRGVETGIMKEPMFRAYMEEATPWEVYPKDVPGHWVAEASWPSKRIVPKVLHFDTGKLSATVGSTDTVKTPTNKVVGLCTQEWLPFPPGGMPVDQAPDDENSLVFDTPLLESDLEILGYPKLHIRVAADVPVAKIAVRLTEVTAEGKSWLVSWGILNLTHRDGHEKLAPLEPGKSYDVSFETFMCAHRFKAGNKIRLAVSESLWPIVWPSPQPAVLSIALGASTLTLPVRPPENPEAPFAVPVTPGMPGGLLGRHPEITVTGPDKDGLITITRKIPEFGGGETLIIKQDDPNAGVWRGEAIGKYEHEGGETCVVRTTFELTSTVENFTIKESLSATKGGATIFERAHEHVIKRDLM